MINFRLPAQPGVLADYNSPDTEYGGGEPASYKSGDGTRFWGTLEKRGGVLKLVVYRTNADATQLLGVWDSSGIIGRGGLRLQADGTLEACGYTAYGDNATMRAVPVPGWVRPAPPSGGGLSAAQAALLDLLARVVALIRAG